MNGNELTIETQAYLVPSVDVRLFSLQSYFMEQPKHDKSGAWVDREAVTLQLGSPRGNKYKFPYHPNNNIPFMLPTSQKTQSKVAQFLTSKDSMLMSNDNYMAQLFSVSDENNQNLTSAQKELQL